MSPYLLEVCIEMLTTNLIVFHGLLKNNVWWGKEVDKIRLTINWQGLNLELHGIILPSFVYI